MVSARWSGWRRDLLAGLIASALTALVLLAVGWALLRAERQQTAAARERAEQAVRRAEAGEAEAARLRDRAEHNLLLARRAVDEYLTAVAEREGANAGPERLRKQLLEEARKFREQSK